MIPSVTVVIPTFNVGSQLPEAIASVRAQQWPNLEIIVVDDGSTDDTENILNALAPGGDLRWFRQKHAGAAAARNRGISEAKGEWLAFLDADDAWLPRKLTRQFEELEKQPNASFSYTDVRLRLSSGAESDLECGVAHRPLLLQLLGGNLFATPTVVVQRECLRKVGLFDSNMRTGEDWDMWLRLAAHFNHVRVPEPLAVIRVADQTRFPVETLEWCTLRALERLFSCGHVARRWPEVAWNRRLIYAWHYSVLAKSYLKHRRRAHFFRLASRALMSHPAGFSYLAGAPRETLEQRVFNDT